MELKDSVWSDEEVKTLFKFVEIKKYEGLPLIKIFAQYAQSTQRHQNSVRNYYYKELQGLIKNESRCRYLGIDLGAHFAKKIEPFSNDGAKSLIQSIDEMRAEGYSVRRACLTLAGGDASLMIRYQNKYRLETKYKKERDMGQIIKMPNKQTAITDEEVNSLFLGLIKLVRKQEFQKVKKSMEDKWQDSNSKLKEAIAEIVVKNRKIEQLQSQIRLLQNEQDKEKLNRIDRKIQKAKVLVEKSAKKTIKEFIKGKTKSDVIEQDRAINNK